MDIKAIIESIDHYLIRSGRQSTDPVKANEVLAKAGLLRDSKDRPGKPLRDLLRKGLLPHAYQSGGKGSSWTIPRSDKINSKTSKHSEQRITNPKKIEKDDNKTAAQQIDYSEVKSKLDKARRNYKPDKIKYLLIAEAPPDSVERFFYFEDVKKHDYLFLGVAQALYPDLKARYLANSRSSEIKKTILETFKTDGFYLLDLSELPISLLKGSLDSQVGALIEKIETVANKQIKTILIKANVFDAAYAYLVGKGFTNVVNIRIPFPGQGGQKKFQEKFREALNEMGYK